MRSFPIHYPEHLTENAKTEIEAVGRIDSVPWAVVAPYEDRAKTDYGKSLEKLAGSGLLPQLMLALIHDKHKTTYRDLTFTEALERLNKILAPFEFLMGRNRNEDLLEKTIADMARLPRVTFVPGKDDPTPYEGDDEDDTYVHYPEAMEVVEGLARDLIMAEHALDEKNKKLAELSRSLERAAADTEDSASEIRRAQEELELISGE